MKKLLLLFLTITSLNSFSQATLLADINQGNGSSNPSNKVTYNGFVYFVANDGLNGSELWRTNGTEAGTEIFKEFITGLESGMIGVTPMVSNSLLYFFAIDNGSNFLWKTDGTEVGTEKVKELSSIGVFLETINNELIFTAGNEIWKTDGTEDGTIKINNFSIFGGNRFIKSGNEIFFSGEGSSSQGQELWKTDGTEAGTVLVKEIRSGSSDSYPSNFATLNGIVYFNANNGTNGYELWKSDGTEAGTLMVKDITSGSSSSNPKHLTAYNNELFFTIANVLWKSDGTDAGTILIKDLATYINGIVAFNNKLFVFNGSNSFWETDGTEVGTIKIEVPVSQFYWVDGAVKVIGNNLYFQASDDYGYELWISDGTANGTHLVKDIYPTFNDNNIQDIVGLNGKAIFTASDGTWLGKEIYISDGTEAGTSLLKDINKEGYQSSTPSNLFLFNNQVLFSANNGKNGNELWATTGNTTSLLKDINVGPSYSNPTSFVELNGVVYFKATTKEKGTELWKTDGTETGTVLVKDINPNTNNGLNLGNIVALNSKLYFFANDGTNGFELWESNGTEAGTILVKDINSGAGNSYRSGEIEVYNNKLYFNANNGSNDFELWSSDGTEAGTALFSDINTSSSSSPDNFILFNNEMYFRANGNSGSGLHRTDGTSTFLVSNKGYNNLTVSGANLFFVSTYNNGGELWRTDGTSAVQVKDIRPGSGGSNGSFPSLLTDHNGVLYFYATDGTNGGELWKSDGTEAGTVMVKDIYNGVGSSNISGLGSFGNHILFGARDVVGSNVELWKSDGTETGTVLFQDINPTTDNNGSRGSSPKDFFVANNNMYFSANDGTSGYELWKLEQSALSVENEKINSLINVNVYPNPSSDIINLKMDNQQIKSVKVFNLMGKQVLNISNKKLEINKINVSQLSSGMYFLMLETEKNTIKKKIIKL
ncbi:MAG: ELWxxDGT repeat protein [Polaribacter sp.]|uniref:ELWxxDGT repeat protein n=1 Tax=Polaribacter sp. TaxID=1920175 RepID=UPI002F358926